MMVVTQSSGLNVLTMLQTKGTKGPNFLNGILTPPLVTNFILH